MFASNSSSPCSKIIGKSIVADFDQILTMELVRVTERTAVAAVQLRGRGDEEDAD